MDEPLEPRVEEKLRGLCKQLSVAHSLDEELREELFGHMEDKLLAYLSGEESVSSEDAFILVREHFGDSAVVRAMLREVHAQEAGVSLARRLTAAFTLAIGVDIGMRVLFSLVTLGFVVQAFWMPSVAVPKISDDLLAPRVVVGHHWASGFAALLLYFVLLRLAKRKTPSPAGNI